jgi:hypothetical protein
MPISDEHIPAEDIRDAILTEAVMPHIAQFSAEAEVPSSYSGLIRVQRRDQAEFGTKGGFWTIRMIVRHTFDETRDLFRIQALLPKQHRTGFRGFHLKGEVRRTSSTILTTPTLVTALYHTTGNEDWS